MITLIRKDAFLATALLLLALSSRSFAEEKQDPVISWQKQKDSVVFRLRSGTMKVQVCTPRVLRVLYGPGTVLPSSQSLSVIAKPRSTAWHLKSDGQNVILITDQVQAKVNRQTGAVRFMDKNGKPILNEVAGGRMLTPLSPAEPAEYKSRQEFVLAEDEDIYGLGQHQSGAMSYRGNTVTLEQSNREIAIPFLLSSRGYGLLWDNPAHTDIAVGTNAMEEIPATQLFTGDGKPGGLTAQYYQGQDLTQLQTTRTDARINFNWTDAPASGLTKDNFSVRWTGEIRAREGGKYTFATTSDDGVRLWIDDKPVIDAWNIHQARMDTATVSFTPGSRHRIRMEYFQGSGEAIARLMWQHGSQSNTVSWTSEVAKASDYYFIYGPSLDVVMREYRGLTGLAPLPGKWALGYWQSKERYDSQQEWLDIADGYRTRKFPIDNLVQDWFYWNPAPWGSHSFDPKRYPDPAAAISTLHDKYHMHLMISVWGKFEPGSPDNPDANYDILNARGFLYPALGEKARYYDAFNPDARALYWSLLQKQIFAKGVDAWWLDASEPEVEMNGFRSIPTARGKAAHLLNAWPLLHTTGVYQGQRTAKPNQRVFILTRSAYAGQQRNAAAAWSGDITASWDVFAKQIPAGLNIGLSGIPYWTTDIGAFFVTYPGGADNPEYRELYTRWFQFGAFCPIFRSHGTNTPREMWRFGPKTERTLLQYDNLRYRLMPYIYSQAWQVTNQAGTIMRALVMDFPQDVTARRSKDEFLFGPAFLVCPVLQPGALSRSVYLPGGTRWTDFWTGKVHTGGRSITAMAPIETMPLYVRGGSIIPMGPLLQYTSEKPTDPIELRVYRGANGAITLYEDDGNSYQYEKGEYATIPIRWDEAKQTLTIGVRQGTFPGMLAQRTFQVVWVRDGHGVGLASAKPDTVIHYTGKFVSTKMPGR